MESGPRQRRNLGVVACPGDLAGPELSKCKPLVGGIDDGGIHGIDWNDLELVIP